MAPRVLLVEDDDIIREIYALKFELENVPVAVAENGVSALAQIKQFQPDIVLLDMMMPVMGGLEFMQKLTASTDHLPVVVVFSNISAPHHRQAVAKLGAREYWVKSDFTPERVVQEVSRLWQTMT
jgi:two-component system OmpR family response regulator